MFSLHKNFICALTAGWRTTVHVYGKHHLNRSMEAYVQNHYSSAPHWQCKLCHEQSQDHCHHFTRQTHSTINTN